MMPAMSSVPKPNPRPRAKRRAGRETTLDDGLFQAVFQNSPAMQSVIRVSDGAVLEVNDTFLQKLNLERAEVIGKTPFELNFWAEPEKLPAYRQELETKGFVQGFEARLRARDGTILTVLLSTRPLKINGRPHYLRAGVDITERKRAEAELQVANERLRQSEERFGKAFRANPVTMAITRYADGTFIAANESLLEATGYREDEVIGHTTRDLQLYHDPDERDEFIRRIDEQGFERNREITVRAKDGRACVLLVSAERIDIEGVPHLLTVGVDITERKRAEARWRESERQFRESEARFATAFQASPVLISMARSSDSTYVEINESFRRFVGLERDQIIGRTSQELGLWVNLAQRARFLENLREGRAVRDLEAELRGQDGTRRTVVVSGDVIEVNGEPHLLVFGLDITQRTQAEARLRESERQLRETQARFSKAFHASPVLMTIARLEDAKFVEVNEAFIRLTGFERDQLIGRDSLQLGLWVSLEDRAAFFEQLQRELVVRNVECRMRTRHGTIHTMQMSGEVIEINREPHLITFGLDITQGKQAEAELQNALARERELSQLKSDFVSLVSHEFRTPLEIILSSADNLQRYHERLAPAKRDQLLQTIRKSVRRMSGMMEEVLLLGRLETDRMTFKPAPFEWRAFCQRMGDEIEAATNKRCPIQLTLRDTPAEAVGDENVLRHIFTNLLSNAVKYSPAGGPVEFAAQREGELAVCRVIDQGCGIPAADQQRMFEAFHRGGNVRQIPGTGLGLLIVQRCVELHGGEIEFSSVEGQGTTFTVRLRLFPTAPTP